jgi:AAA15 family ATPase/GTPase
MGIKRIRIENFKSFKKLDVELKDFNILIGANASGKSNFIHIFEFLRDIVNNGLDNAISMQGDVEYLRNVSIGHTDNFTVEITSDYDDDRGILLKPGGDYFWGIRMSEMFYKFAVEFLRSKPGYKIIEDNLLVKFGILKVPQKGEKEIKVGDGAFKLINNKGKIKTEFDIPTDIKIDRQDIFPFVDFIKNIKKFPSKSLLLETPFFKMPFEVADIFQGVSVYNIDPKLPKKAIPITGKTELEEDGSNLAIALKNIIDDKNERNRFSNLIKDVLSFVESLDIEKFADSSLLVILKEVYSGDKFLPASLLSDGTINITALILALYFGKKPFIVIEEPERNIHPHLISKILEMMKEVASRRQIIVTTHNSEILKHAALEDILFIARDHEGFSQISRPCDNEQVKIFLKNEMGIDDLFVQNLLEL